MGTTDRIALRKRLTLDWIIDWLDLLVDSGLDKDLVDAMLSNKSLSVAAINAMKSLHKSNRSKPERPVGKEFVFDVPEHLGSRLYRKATVTEGWYPERVMRLAPNTERTAHIKKNVRGRLLPASLNTFNGPEIVARLHAEGLGSGTLEQLLGFVTSYRDISEHFIILAPGTVSTDMEGFSWCFPSYRTWYPSGAPEHVLSLDLVTDREVFLLGIVPQD